MHEQLHTAISDHWMVEFWYGGHQRIVEPHIYGTKGGLAQLFGYQTGGSSASGSLPQWRRFDLESMSGMLVLDVSFDGPRPTPPGVDRDWDEIFASVK